MRNQLLNFVLNYSCCRFGAWTPGHNIVWHPAHPPLGVAAPGLGCPGGLAISRWWTIPNRLLKLLRIPLFVPRPLRRSLPFGLQVATKRQMFICMGFLLLTLFRGYLFLLRFPFLLLFIFFWSPMPIHTSNGFPAWKILIQIQALWILYYIRDLPIVD